MPALREEEMTYELKKNLALFDLLRNRAVCDCRRRRDKSLVWPGRPAYVPKIILDAYERERAEIFARAAAANRACQAYANGLNAQRGT